MTYRIELPPECDAMQMLPKLRQLEEEEPELHIVWDEALQELQAKIMGEVQTGIKESHFREIRCRGQLRNGSIVYKETIANTVEVWGISSHCAIMRKCICC